MKVDTRESRVQRQAVLLRRAQDGDVPAFELLISEYSPSVRRFARSMCRDAATADDVAQDALLKAYQRIRSYRFQAAFSTWLFRIVRNTLIDHSRSAHVRREAKAEPLEAACEIPAPGTAPDVASSTAELRQSLWEALARLPLEFRTAVVLFDVEGFSQDEVAAIEKVAVGTVKSRLSRGRSMLRKMLSDELDDNNCGNGTIEQSVLPEGATR